ncbi:NADase-type glycan-binding domain-containing protein [Chryseolinea lacunae]|uniref:Hint domain-containing protein n=1 Tax=Chryseolinea lacunae TaxID=2801331 RepID=A0ABS1KWB7_9BACT|nr:hypothetical protein [Chryseolinea lacunae]MBL0742596.1 hypothetical protein [Chryseolinea lacunae]
MQRIFFHGVLFLALMQQHAMAQSGPKELFPSSITPLNFSREGEQQFERDKQTFLRISDKLQAGTSLQDLPASEQALYNAWDETSEDYWDILGGGCSWYCGGGPEKVTASSWLKPQGGNSYDANNAHDLNYKTAWVEGVAGPGVGQYLRYAFLPESARVNEIIVVNGYVKDQTAWENNARVKKLKVLLNDKPLAMLNLKDQRAAQHFTVDPIGNNNRSDWDKLKSEKAWTLTFEIQEVYKGLKYDDAAITEIYFDGLDVHCFAKGTRVTMANGNTKNIETIAPGDVVMSRNEAGEMKPAVVEEVKQVSHHNLVKFTFADGNSIVATKDHPFLLKGKGWASLNPGASSAYQGFEHVELITLHDAFEQYSPDGTLTTSVLTKIEFLKGHYDTYTITKLAGGKTFVANGCVVGVEALASDY